MIRTFGSTLDIQWTSEASPHDAGEGHERCSCLARWRSAAKYQRLIEAKIKWDPSNMLRHSTNI
jgi:Berberine and berberine like